MSLNIVKVEFTMKFHTEDGLPYKKVTHIERTIVLDGELLYTSKIAYSIYRIEKSPLRDFERWLLGEEQVKRSSNIAGDRSDKVDLFRHGWFKRFNLKLQLFNLKIRKKFFALKASGFKKV
jgi:hypothetical protein